MTTDIFIRFFLIFFAVGCSGQKEYKNVQEVDDNGRSIVRRSAIGGFTEYTDVRNMKKHIDLFKHRFDEATGSYDFQVDDGNPDIHGRIERPCEVYDSFCIRKFFAEQSHCKISGRAVPDPLHRAQLTVNYPNTNMSATQLNVEYRGLNNVIIEEFYINKATDSLLIALNFPSVVISSNQTYLRFNLRGREPVVTRDFGAINTIDFTATVVIPHLNDLKLEEAEIIGHMGTPAPFLVGPGLAASTDPEVLAMLTTFLTRVPIDQMEAFLTEAFFFAATFIQYNICDFGIKVL